MEAGAEMLIFVSMMIGTILTAPINGLAEKKQFKMMK
jgi:hypothetical protein